MDQELVAMGEAHGAGDVDAICKLLDARPDLEHKAPETWLHRAAETGHIAVVDFCLERGWDVNLNLYENAKKDGLATPLHFAKDAAMTRHLLSRGALLNSWTRYGGTPLHFAVISATEPSQKGRRREGGANVDQIRALLEAGADLSLSDYEGNTPLALAIELRRKTAEQVLREAGAPEKGRRPGRQPAKTTRLDLCKDFNKLYAHVVRRAKRFDPAKNAGPGDGKSPISAIEFGFTFEQDGWVVLVFDTRPAAEPNGEWTSFIDQNMLKQPHWQAAFEAIASESVEVVLPDGSKRRLASDTNVEEYATLLGELLKGVLLKARTDGVLKELPKAERCHLAVEELEGRYGWPHYEDRDKEDLL